MNKKLFMAIAAIILAVGGFTIISCNKDNSKLENLRLEKNLYAPCSNSLNPFDEVGFLHNYYLQEMIDDKVFDNESAPPLDLTEMREWIYGHAGYMSGYGINADEFSKFYEKLYQSSRTLYWDFIDSLEMSSESKENVKKMISVAVDIFLETGKWDYDLYYDSITLRESCIMTSPFYSLEENQSELRAVLSFASILRHSLFYWTNNNNVMKKSDKGPGTWGIIIADAAAALVSWNICFTGLASVVALYAAVANGDVTIEKDGDTYNIIPIEDDGNGNGNEGGGESGANGNNQK